MTDGCVTPCACGASASCCCATGIGYALYRYFKKGGYDRIKNATGSLREEDSKEIKPSKLEKSTSP